MSAARRGIASILEGAIRRGDPFVVNVVFTGKLKPVEMALYEVLFDGMEAKPHGTDEPRRYYPFAGMTSLEVTRL